MKSIFLAVVSLLFVSCFPDMNTDIETQPVDYTVQNEKDITAYIAKNNLTAIKSDSGLFYVIDVAGEGAQPTASSTVTVEYRGYFTNGSVFDGGKPGGLTIGLQQVIRGWTEGIPYFKEGGSGILLVPSHLGYGSYDRNGIPGGSVLIFDVKLIKVN
ncbi:peptidylprolyl isomerase [Flavobacterium sp. XN-5]|uniref:FKBP-type peptidyl-prolyl cis-trans isomerase n=1 Tax=Flavobacterium sp. XN-5 TaxID=2599390 RepID=UPI0011C83D7D|nr:FKBP-type peptidyl-prolyl cis-trans isomerase [Flavobacterium sp. XN-5]NGY36631.1 peptidylprolyl isomerase [Flavobacterium sp. XN-5]